MKRTAAAAGALALLSCTSGGGTSPSTGPCPRVPRAADRARAVIVSRPYDAGSGPANTWERLELATDGTLSPSGPVFEMGRATDGEIAFTPDGELGFVAQQDGTLGVFRLPEAGGVDVLHASLSGAFYAARVVVDPDGTHAYVIDTNWRKNGGGIYALSIGCNDEIVEEGLVAAAKLPAGLAFLGDAEQAVVAATDILGSTAGQDAHLLGWGATPSIESGVDAFGDDEAIISALEVTANGHHALIGDNSAFSGIPNRVAVVEVGANGLTARQVLTPIEDPVAIVASPLDDAAIVVSAFGDAIFGLAYDPANAAAPFTVTGELAYTGGAPQLPAVAIRVPRGALSNRVLIAENTAVRQVRFDGGGVVTDLGPTSLGTGVVAIVGALGVQP